VVTGCNITQDIRHYCLMKATLFSESLLSYNNRCTKTPRRPGAWPGGAGAMTPNRRLSGYFREKLALFGWPTLFSKVTLFSLSEVFCGLPRAKVVNFFLRKKCTHPRNFSVFLLNVKSCCRRPVWSHRMDLAVLSICSITTRARNCTPLPGAEWNVMWIRCGTFAAVCNSTCQVIKLAQYSLLVAIRTTQQIRDV